MAPYFKGNVLFFGVRCICVHFDFEGVEPFILAAHVNVAGGGCGSASITQRYYWEATRLCNILHVASLEI